MTTGKKNERVNKDVNNKVHDFIRDLAQEHDILRYAYNKKEFIPGESSIYYSGPVWDESEIAAAITSLLTGKWLSSGENVLKFERKIV